MPRLTININDETDAALRELAEKQGTTVTEQIRRAVGIYKFFLEEEREIQLFDGCDRTTVYIL
jgi:hypothetical protein